MMEFSCSVADLLYTVNASHAATETHIQHVHVKLDNDLLHNLAPLDPYIGR